MEKRFIVAAKNNVRLVDKTGLKIFLYDAVITREYSTNFTVIDLNKLDEVPLSVILDITSYCNYESINIVAMYYMDDYDTIKDLIVKHMSK